MSTTPRFQFVEDLNFHAAETLGVVEIPIGIKDKQQLLRTLARDVPLPDYFGGNWDALDECLRDRLSEESRGPLCLLHRDLPLIHDEQSCRDYLSLLQDTLDWMTKDGVSEDGVSEDWRSEDRDTEEATCEFSVVFPSAWAGTIEQLDERG